MGGGLRPGRESFHGGWRKWRCFLRAAEHFGKFGKTNPNCVRELVVVSHRVQNVARKARWDGVGGVSGWRGKGEREDGMVTMASPCRVTSYRRTQARFSFLIRPDPLPADRRPVRNDDGKIGNKRTSRFLHLAPAIENSPVFALCSA